MKYLIRMRNADGTQFLGRDDCWGYNRSHAIRFSRENADTELEQLKASDSYQNGDTGLWNLEVVEDEPCLVQIGERGITEMDDQEESGEHFYIARVQSWVDEETIGALVEEDYPYTYCQHEYDCCGRRYYGRASWSKTDLPDYSGEEWVTILIRQPSHLNI